MGNTGAAKLAAALAVLALAAGCGGSSATAKPNGPNKSTTPAAVAATPVTSVTSAGNTSTPTTTPTTDPSSQADYSAGKSTLVADDTYPQYGDLATDVLHYGLDLKWDLSAKVLTGKATLAIRAAKDTDHFVLDLAPFLTADSVSVDGKAVGDVRNGDHLTVNLNRQVAADTTTTVVIAYHGTPQLVPAPVTRRDIPGLGATTTAAGGVWSQQEPYGAFTWYPCNDQPSDRALYDVTITAPDGWAGVSGGTFVGRSEANGFGVYRWHQPRPVSTYLVAFAVDRFKESTATGPHGLPITFWYLPEMAADEQRLAPMVPDMISFLEQRFGPYPYDTAGVLWVPGDSGMETTTMITISARIQPGDLLHEFAHHWFGDAVTPTTWSGMWLNEGFAMYSQFLWDVAHPQLGIPATMDEYMTSRIRPRDQATRTKDGPPGHYLPNHFGSVNVYYCPALMLNGIRDKIGESAFDKLSAAWVQQHRDTNQDRASFIAFVNQNTGHDFTAYINAWLDSPTTPTLAP